MPELRSLLFALFQFIVTPIYAVLVLLGFWLPPVPRFKFITGWCWIDLAAARLICGIRHRVLGGQNISPGGARLAIALGVPIVPVAHNAGYLWPKGVLGKRSGTVTVSIGPPIRTEGKDMQRLINEVETWIEDEVARLGNPLGKTPAPHG